MTEWERLQFKGHERHLEAIQRTMNLNRNRFERIEQRLEQIELMVHVREDAEKPESALPEKCLYCEHWRHVDGGLCSLVQPSRPVSYERCPPPDWCPLREPEPPALTDMQIGNAIENWMTKNGLRVSGRVYTLEDLGRFVRELMEGATHAKP